MSIEKPAGYDLREKRAEKEAKSSAWTAEDAVYSTHDRIKGKDITQFVAYWWERMPDGSEVMHFSNATSNKAEQVLLLSKALHVALEH